MQSDLRSNQSRASFDRSLVKNVNAVHKVHVVDSVKKELQVFGSCNFPCNKQVPDIPWKQEPLWYARNRASVLETDKLLGGAVYYI